MYSDILKNYNGNNAYIKHIQTKFKSGSEVSEYEQEYVVENWRFQPKVIKKLISISYFMGAKLMHKFNLEFLPKKVWVENLIAKSKRGFHVEGKLFQNQETHKMFWIDRTGALDDIDPTPIDYTPFKISKLDGSKREPYEFQKIGINKLVNNDRFILSDDMGLGKTLTSVVSMVTLFNLGLIKRVLIVCPTSLKENWEREIRHYSDIEIGIVKSGKKWNASDITIVSYDILKKFHTPIVRGKPKPKTIARDIVESNFDLIIFDEAHYLKNSKAQRTKTANDLCLSKKFRRIPRVWLLTGTPLTNRPYDYYNLLKIVEHDIVESWSNYIFRYCDAKIKHIWITKGGRRQKIKTTDYNGSSNTQELYDRVRNSVLYRKKSDVRDDLPDKLRFVRYIDLGSSRREYDTLFDEYNEWCNTIGKDLGNGVHLVKMTLLRKYLSTKKIEHTIELADEAIENDKKVIIFTNYVDTVNALQEHYGKSCVSLYGKTKQSDRQKIVDKFQADDKVKVFVGNMLAAGVGITLTSAEIVIMNDISYVPSDMTQAEDRAYRIGQDKDVMVYYLLFKDTVEEYVYDMVQEKMAVIEEAMGETFDDEEFYGDLTRRMKIFRQQGTSI